MQRIPRGPEIGTRWGFRNSTIIGSLGLKRPAVRGAKIAENRIILSAIGLLLPADLSNARGLNNKFKQAFKQEQ